MVNSYEFDLNKGRRRRKFEELWLLIEIMRLSAAVALMDILQLRRAMALNRDYAAFSRCGSYGYSTTSKSYGS
jgi:hypothetical protein